MRKISARITASCVKIAQLNTQISLVAAERTQWQRHSEAQAIEIQRLLSLVAELEGNLSGLRSQLAAARDAELETRDRLEVTSKALDQRNADIDALRRPSADLTTTLLERELQTLPTPHFTDTTETQDKSFPATHNGSDPLAQGRADLSIIVWTSGDPAAVMRCVAGIRHYASDVSSDVTLVDDASGDPLLPALSAEGIKVLRNANKLGFAKSLNNAIAKAGAHYALILDGRCEITRHAIARLLDAVTKHIDAAIVGPKIVDRERRLLNAGCIVWKDGSASAYGCAEDPTAPQFNYFREVDYISPAAMLINKQLFDAAGGFDEMFEPELAAADLAFKTRQLGYKVYFEPTSVVIQGAQPLNFSGKPGSLATCGDSCQSFKHRWQTTLDNEHFTSGSNIFIARDRSCRRPCVLVIDHYVPRPDQDAGSRTIASFMQLFLRMGMNVKFWGHDRQREDRYSSQLTQTGIELLHETACTFEDWIKQHGSFVDYAFLSRPHVAIEFISAIRQHSNAKVLYYGHDIHHLRIRQQLKTDPTNEYLRSDAEFLGKLEQRVWGLADVIYYPSIEETDYVSEWLRDSERTAEARTIMPFGFGAPERVSTVEIEERSGIIFVGGFAHPPNADAAKWFVSEILPSVRAQCPEVHLQLVGSNPLPDVTALAGSGITVTGHVSDEELARLYRASRVAVAPLRFGGGVKGKVVEAMGYGVPIVTTITGVQGLDTARRFLPVANDQNEFVQLIVKFLIDDAAWRETSNSCLAFANGAFLPENAYRVLLQDFSIPDEPLSSRLH